jgi:hypothetical protein
MNPDLPVQASDHAAGVFGAFAGIGVLGLILVLLASIFWIWMLIDCATNPALDGTQKIVWVLVIVFLHFLGALIYMVAGRRKTSTTAAGP